MEDVLFVPGSQVHRRKQKRFCIAGAGVGVPSSCSITFPVH